MIHTLTKKAREAGLESEKTNHSQALHFITQNLCRSSDRGRENI